jgi:hypothetical protein
MERWILNTALSRREWKLAGRVLQAKTAEPVDKATVKGTPAQLVEVYYTADGEDITWTFDARGNRLTEQKYAGGSSTGNITLEYYANSDLIKTRGNWQFNYDKNGNMISRGTGGTWNGSDYTWASDSGELWEYGYDLSNRMISVKKSSAGTSGLKAIAAYVYDIRGLRVESIKTLLKKTAGPLPTAARRRITSTDWTENYCGLMTERRRRNIFMPMRRYGRKCGQQTEKVQRTITTLTTPVQQSA